MNADASVEMNDEILLLQNGFLRLPHRGEADADRSDEAIAETGTILANLAYYGYAASFAVVTRLMALDAEGRKAFWTGVEPALARVSGEDRNMGDFVVYKNFPEELLDMDQARYWFNQILMYFGAPKEWFTEPAEEREPMTDRVELKTLDAEDEGTLDRVFASLRGCPSEWTNAQSAQARHLADGRPRLVIDIGSFSFKANGVNLAVRKFASAMTPGQGGIAVSSATDALRIAAGLAGGDVELRRPVRFRNFTRPERRALLSLIENAPHLEQDFATRPEQWKRLLERLRPGDFRFERVSAAYDRLYNRRIRTVESRIEQALRAADPEALDILGRRPGEFMRRLHKAYEVFGRRALEAFAAVIDDLTLHQLLKLDRYLRTSAERKNFIAAPRGDWSKAQVIGNTKWRFRSEDLAALREDISRSVAARIDSLHPEGFVIDARTERVKLQANGQELAPYGRGTSFAIPGQTKFLRTASYWKHSTGGGNTWFDVGWNFFDENWTPAGAVCWDSTERKGAVFSGDPTNAAEAEGRACQMIDLYPETLAADGVRYAVWSVLCFSRVPFAEADEVLATLQWGEEPQKGELYEPARAQMVFPLTGTGLTKFVAYVDLVERRLVYMDVNLPGNADSAARNEQSLTKLMPAFLEHLEAQPSVLDLFAHARAGSIPVLENDADLPISGKAYVFRKVNADSRIVDLDLERLLNAKGGDAPSPTESANADGPPIGARIP